MIIKKTRPKYPSKEEILNNLPKANKSNVKILQDWKTNTWQPNKKKGEEHNFLALKTLIKQLSKHFNSEVSIKFRPSIPSCCYFPNEKTIYLNNSLSIVSSLHELGHHLFGSSELKACRWSVSLFRDAFPKSYSKLQWKGHLLIKGQN